MEADAPNQPFPWLFVYFRQIYGGRCELDKSGELYIVPLTKEQYSDEAMHMAWSRDGVQWTPLNDNRPILSAPSGGGIRDPFVRRGHDGAFHLLATGGTASASLWCASTSDLARWPTPTSIPLMATIAGARHLWAPEFLFDPQAGDYFVYWSSSFSQHGWEGASAWCCRTRDFIHFTTPRKLFDPGYTIIDAHIFLGHGRYYMIFKDERFGVAFGEHRYLLVAAAEQLEGPWETLTGAITPSLTEGPAVMRHPDGRSLLYCDHCMANRYGLFESRDLLNWSAVEGTRFPAHARHGSLLAISEAELAQLRQTHP